MASIVGIANSALIKLGASTITALPDGSKNSILAAEQYDKTRRQLLREHPWNCAIGRAKLGQLSDAPAFEFDHAYQLPTDWLRTLNVSDNTGGLGEPEYHIEGNTIVSSADDIYLKYVKDLSDPNVMDASFREALAFALAADLCIALTASNTLKEQMDKGKTDALLSARSIDSIEDWPEQEEESSWTTCRY